MPRVRKHHLMRWIMQKRRAAFHRAENPARAFETQCLRSDPLTLGYPADQRLGLMDIQVIHDQMPLCRLRITLNQALDVRQTVFLGAGRSEGGLDHLPGHDIEIDKPGQRPMPDILELASEHMAGLHWQVRMLSLQRLNPGQLIQTDGPLPLPRSLGRMCIQLAPLDDLLFALGVGNFR